ncbi:endothelin-3 [Grus japonensis]|uniref:Endothelin-3 n=1 Tax=Grus japonensis TaxID=30415 RepID=A0ABC9XLK6_GRUJA
MLMTNSVCSFAEECKTEEEIMDQRKRQRRKMNAGKKKTLSFSSTESLEDSEQSAQKQELKLQHSLEMDKLDASV